jgi:hypothetical protein
MNEGSKAQSLNQGKRNKSHFIMPFEVCILSNSPIVMENKNNPGRIDQAQIAANCQRTGTETLAVLPEWFHRDIETI